MLLDTSRPLGLVEWILSERLLRAAYRLRCPCCHEAVAWLPWPHPYCMLCDLYLDTETLVRVPS